MHAQHEQWQEQGHELLQLLMLGMDAYSPSCT